MFHTLSILVQIGKIEIKSKLGLHNKDRKFLVGVSQENHHYIHFYPSSMNSSNQHHDTADLTEGTDKFQYKSMQR